MLVQELLDELRSGWKVVAPTQEMMQTEGSPLDDTYVQWCSSIRNRSHPRAEQTHIARNVLQAFGERLQAYANEQLERESMQLPAITS